MATKLKSKYTKYAGKLPSTKEKWATKKERATREECNSIPHCKKNTKNKKITFDMGLAVNKHCKVSGISKD
ncbi:hypothetical protein [Bartonella massiliensis]|uniref:hypothetical protein n=1 Tax=Bartonella massiliensis TaxID=929795 RepID=UPI00115B9DCC|nr:hypothetical protein [Bartonella massiliensis]